MKKYFAIFSLSLITVACVPAKKYQELVDKQEECSEELAKFKSMGLTAKEASKTLQEKYSSLEKQMNQLKADTLQTGRDYRNTLAKYESLQNNYDELMTSYDNLRKSGASETADLSSDLRAKKLEIQQKRNELLAKEKELKEKQLALAEREQRVRELEEMIQKKDLATQELKNKVAAALKGFTDKGLTVEEKNGKIYVSLEAKLLFASGSTKVEKEGENALIELSKVLENEKDLEIIVEGHTDTDPLKSNSHPKSNWELSVLRSTSVIEILLKNSTINPQQLMAAGRSEFIPIDKNVKAKNRRIEVIISPNLNELFELISQ